MTDSDDQIRDSLQRLTSPDPTDGSDVWEGVMTRRRRRRLVAGSLAVAASVAVMVVTVQLLSSGGQDIRVATGVEHVDGNRNTDSTSVPTTSARPESYDTTTTIPLSEFDVVTIGVGGFTGARSSADGKELVIAFIGGPPFDEHDPCSVQYRAEAMETADQVSVTVYENSPADGPTACTQEGYFRTVTLTLSQPIGLRSLLVEPEPEFRPLFDGSTLATPGWLPNSWELQQESQGYYRPDPSTTWMRTWGPAQSEPVDRLGSPCVPAPETPISLTQGPPNLLDDTAMGDPEPEEHTVHDIRGSEATYGFDKVNTTARLQWVENGQAFVVTTRPDCSGDTLTTRDVLIRFAEGLRVP